LPGAVKDNIVLLVDMKAIKKILFFDAVDQCTEPIFQALFKKGQGSDAVLANSGLEIISTGKRCRSGDRVEEDIKRSLTAAEITDFTYLYTNLFDRPKLIEWADLILVPTLLEEDMVCINFPEARSKTISIMCYGQPLSESSKAKQVNGQPDNGYDSIIDWFSFIMPILFGVIKDSYSEALVAKGQCIYPGTILGPAFVAKSGKELEKFEEGSIMVIDRPGIFLSVNIGKTMDSTIRKKSSKLSGEGQTAIDLKKEMDEFIAKVEGKRIGVAKFLFPGNGFIYFRNAVNGAKGLIFCRGRNRGEMLASALRIPCISSCIGATERLYTGQAIVVDAGRGEIYDASRLLKL